MVFVDMMCTNGVENYCRHDVHKGTKSHEMLMNPIEMLMNLTKLKVVTMTTSKTLSWSKKLGTYV